MGKIVCILTILAASPISDVYFEKAYEQVNGLTPHEAELVAENLILSTKLYRSMLLEVAATMSAKDSRKSAA